MGLGLSKAKYFTKLDVWWGYNNMWIREGDKCKATFQTNWGMFVPLVMFLGLTNSPVTSQTLMNDIFKELMNEGVVTIYMIDILIFSLPDQRTTSCNHATGPWYPLAAPSISQGREMHIWTAYGWIPWSYPFRKSCRAEPSQGHWHLRLANPHECDQTPIICGISQFLLTLCPRFFTCCQTTPSTHKERGSLEIGWGGTGGVWRAQLPHNVHPYPSPTRPECTVQVETDALGYATRVVLSQLCDDGKWNQVGFTSKGLDTAERNYEIHNKELLSVINGFK